MRRLLQILLTILSSRATTPVVLSVFLLIYVAIAFFSTEPLVTLMRFTATTPLSLLLSLVPLNCVARLYMECRRFLSRRGVMGGTSVGIPNEELFDERCDIPGSGSLENLQERLVIAGYHTRLTAGSLAAWRGVAVFPARMLLLTAIVAMFAGILMSVTLRSSQRQILIEGEPFLQATGPNGIVKKIELRDYSGLFLEKTVFVEVIDNKGASRSFGLYPPSMYGGSFVYPRYLGIAPLIRFSAPDLPAGFETFFMLAIYPPGKEDSAVIPDSPYRIVFDMVVPEPGNDPFSSGLFKLNFKVLKGEDMIASSTLPMGGSWGKDGYRLAIPEFRRMITVDLVRDSGVQLIWISALLGIISLLSCLSIRLLNPRREMLFVDLDGDVNALSRAEGDKRRHDNVFHEALDFLAMDRGDAKQP